MPRISAKNQVTIPVAALQRAGLEPGDEVVVEALDDGELRVRRGEATVEDAFGALTGVYPPGYLAKLDDERSTPLIYSLDADVLIGALDSNDPHHGHAKRMFSAWHDRRDSTFISVVNLSEVLIAPARDQRTLHAARTAIAALGLSVHRPTEAIGVDAARVRARYPISLPDSYLLATARRLGATIASFDRTVLRAARAEGISTNSGR